MANEKVRAEDVPMDDAVDMGLEEAAPTEEAPRRVRMRYVGVPPYGTEFLTQHSVDKDDVRAALLRTGMDEDDVKERVRSVKPVVWHRDRGFVAEVQDLPQEFQDLLANDPSWKTVE